MRLLRRNLLVAFRLCVMCLIGCLIVVLFLTLFPLVEDNTCHRNGSGGASNSGNPLSNIIASPVLNEEDHFLCLIIPFRDRFEELNEFVPTISEYLNKQSVAHAIFVVNQIDTLRFNRASLINVGFLKSEKVLHDLGSKNCDYVALHDVDLVPLNPELPYTYPDKGPFHVAAPGLHPKYDYPDFLGGILLISREHFYLANGMSNRYWGWGLEDDEFHRRLVESHLKIQRPINITTGTEATFRHFHSAKVRKRDMALCYNQQKITRKRDRETGLKTVSFKMGRTFQNCIDNVAYTLLNVELLCDRNKTGWCDCKDAPPQEKLRNLPRDPDVIVPIIPRKRKTVKKR